MDDLWATKNEDVGLIVRAIVSKFFHLCGHDLPTSQTDGQSTSDSKTALCTVVHRTVKTSGIKTSCRPPALDGINHHCSTAWHACRACGPVGRERKAEIRDILRPRAGLAGTRDIMAQIRDIPDNPGRVATLDRQQACTNYTPLRSIDCLATRG